MKIHFTLAITAALTATLASPVSAQLADKRSFMHPLGFWSNNYYVAQRRIYPPALAVAIYYADPELLGTSAGGGLLHERNW
jgi:hypothetical protein